MPGAAGHGHRLGAPLRLPLEDPLDRLRRRRQRFALVPLEEELMGLRRAEQGEGGETNLRIRGDPREQRGEMSRQAMDRGAIEEVDVVLHPPRKTVLALLY